MNQGGYFPIFFFLRARFLAPLIFKGRGEERGAIALLKRDALSNGVIFGY
jgi:hypothetical protein